MDYVVGTCYTFEEDTQQGWSAWVYMGAYWVKVA